MNVDILTGLFLIALGLFLLKRGKVGGVIPFSNKERPLLFYATVSIAIGGGIIRIILSFVNG